MKLLGIIQIIGVLAYIIKSIYIRYYKTMNQRFFIIGDALGGRFNISYCASL